MRHKKILYSIGDSVVWGAELENIEKERFSNSLSKKLGAVDCNNATAGVSNDYIFRHAIRDINHFLRKGEVWSEESGWVKGDEFILCMGITSPTRFEWWDGKQYQQERLWKGYDKWGKNDEKRTINIIRGEYIFGTPLPLIKGKTTKPTSTPSYNLRKVNVPLPILQHHQNIDLFIDFMFVNGIPFLHTISSKIRYRHTIPYNSRKKEIIIKQLHKIIKTYNERGFTIENIAFVGGAYIVISLFLLIFLDMKPLSVEMACLLGIQNEIQAVCFTF